MSKLTKIVTLVLGFGVAYGPIAGAFAVICVILYALGQSGLLA